MDLDVIKSYLVSLGFTIDQPALGKFNDALRNISVQVERVTTGTPFGMVAMFAKAGAAVTGVLATIATGTIGLMDHVAQADLGYQLFARRMFMTTDAAKSLKIATDALGVSLEDIVWGPKELRDRFGVLTADQGRMQAGLGPDYAAQLKAIRDVRFEFTRLEVEMKYLSMGVVADLGRALFGDEGSLLGKLKEFNEWLIRNLPAISQEIASKLAPILKDMGHVLKDLWDIAKQINARKIADDIVFLADGLKKVVDFIASSPILQRMIFGSAAGAAIGAPFGMAGPGAVVGGILGGTDALAGDSLEQGKTGIEKFLGKYGERTSIKDLIRKYAIAMGLDPAIALSIAERESGFNPRARGTSGEIGLFQLMPNTAKGLGVDPNDLTQNIRGGIGYFLQLYARYGDVKKAFEHYNGSGPAARAYAEDMMRRVPRWERNLDYSGSGAHSGVTIGKLDINITHPGATHEQIQSAVTKGIRDASHAETQRNLTQLSGVYA